jgi:DNA-binding PadR family transcriptional regulator
MTKENAPRIRNDFAYGLLASLWEHPNHAYGLQKPLKELGYDKLSYLASVYTYLRRLEKNGLVTVESVQHRGKRRKTVFAITEQGIDVFLASTQPHSE